MAMGALAAHKLRSALTLLGVLVGVFSIIVVMTAMRVLQSNIETRAEPAGQPHLQHPEMAGRLLRRAARAWRSSGAARTSPARRAGRCRSAPPWPQSWASRPTSGAARPPRATTKTAAQRASSSGATPGSFPRPQLDRGRGPRADRRRTSTAPAMSACSATAWRRRSSRSARRWARR